MSNGGGADDDHQSLLRDAPHLFVSGANIAGWRALAAADRAAHAAQYAAQLHAALTHLHAVAKRAHGSVSIATCVVSDSDAASLRLVLTPSTATTTATTTTTTTTTLLAFTAPEAVTTHTTSTKTIASDIYSYGCVLYWLANGVEPFAQAAARSRKSLLHAITKQTAAKAMPLAESMPMYAEIRAATRHKPHKRTLLRPTAPIAVVAADADAAADAAAAVAPTSTFKQRAANRQSRVVGGAVVDAAAAAAASARQSRHGTLRTLRRTSRGDDEAAAFGDIFGADARAMLAHVVAERAQEGIFRVPGDAADIDAFVAGRKPLAEIRSVYTVASLLKRALREHSAALIAPLADREARELLRLAEQANSGGGGGDDDDETAAELVDQLRALLRAHCSEQQRLALRHLARALHALVAAERENRMSLAALLTCIGPSLQCAPGWLKWAVLRFDRMFKKQDNSDANASKSK
jgi:hypothetical protein